MAVFTSADPAIAPVLKYVCAKYHEHAPIMHSINELAVKVLCIGGDKQVARIIIIF